MSAAAEYLRRALVPRLVIRLLTLRWPQRLRARLKQAFGRPARIELYFAFDDPYAAIGLPGLVRIAQRHRAELVLHPLIERGIRGDPAGAQRRAHAIADSRRLARRNGRDLSRFEPVPPDAAAFLAAWTEAAPAASRAAFATGALERVWLSSSGPVRPEDFTDLYRKATGQEPPPDPAAFLPRVAANHGRLLRKGHWESPAARVEGEWFLAHERLDRIEERLRELGWGAP